VDDFMSIADSLAALCTALAAEAVEARMDR